MKIRIALMIISFLVSISSAFSQTKNQADNYKKHFIGSDVFMLANFAPNSPNYYCLNYGYRIIPKDVVLIEAMTWGI